MNVYDFYGEEGCCLTCDEAEEGCLCYECKCRRCIHYVQDYDWDEEPIGHCDLTELPEGQVVITAYPESITVKIQPYIEKQKFENLLALLKGRGFHYNAEDKVWFQELLNETQVLSVKDAVESFGIKVAVFWRKSQRTLEGYVHG
jgi:hypothetical protein